MNSILSYPDRGAGGRSSYRGNCSPHLIEDLIEQFKVKEISDYMCGSGTTEDVAKQKGIVSHCYDLNRGFDLLSMDIPERNRFVFWHPPYGDMVIYSGEQYSAEDVINRYGFDPREHDLSRLRNWDDFVKAMNYCMVKQFGSLEPGGRIAVLMGDMKRKGRLYSMLCDIVKPGTLENIVIKTQHNCVSDRRTYSNKNFIPIVHEYLLICRKDEPLLVPLKWTVNRTADMRDMKAPTWRDVIAGVMGTKRGSWSLDEIYSQLDGHKRTSGNNNWQAKVRQTLQINPQTFVHQGRGMWALAA